MSYSAITTPAPFMAGYSPVPIKLYDTDYNQYPNYKYVVNIAWDKRTITSDSAIVLNNNSYTKLTFSATHDFKVGDTVLLDNSINLDQNTGYYTVFDVLSSTSIAIDLIPSIPLGTPGSTLSKVIKYNLNPDIDGYGKTDLSGVLKDFVTYNFTGQSVNYTQGFEGDNTRFCFDLYCGREFDYELNFTNSLSSGGTLGFYTTGITSVTATTFQVGDIVNVTQDLSTWPYTDNYFSSGSVGFTGSTIHPFLTGQSITITGQITNPSYNGISTILSKTNNAFVINKPYGNASPVESGTAIGLARPTYDGVATITAIFIHATYGLVILTNKTYGTATTYLLPGSISLASGKKKQIPISFKLENFCVFNTHLTYDEFTMTEFNNNYVVSASSTNQRVSTVLDTTNRYVVDYNGIGFLLVHNTTANTTAGLLFRFFDKNNTQLGSIRVNKPAGALDYYIPYGINQLLNGTYINVSGTFATYATQVVYYDVCAYEMVAGTPTQRTKRQLFEVEQECSKYETYNLIWKDRFGSYINMLFDRVSRKNISTQRQSYYKQPASWEYNTYQLYDYERGETNYYNQTRNSYIVNSNWMKDFDTDRIESLMSSPQVFIQFPNGKIFGCMLTLEAVELYKQINEDLFQYQFEVKVANNEYYF
jgi:hypothetical protein